MVMRRVDEAVDLLLLAPGYGDGPAGGPSRRSEK
jgi:hypothetical protein